MPIYDDGRQRRTTPVSVRSSVAVELSWILHSALRRDFSDDHPALHAMFEQSPQLRAAIAGLWEAEGQTGAAGFAELLLLAHHAGLLLAEDGQALLEGLPAACATVPTSSTAYPMRAEAPGDRDVVRRRLQRLRRSAPTRERYIDVLRQVWAAAAGSWDGYGRAAVAATVETKRALLAKGATWQDLARGACEIDAAARAEAALGAGGEIVVVPAYYAHVGLLVDLPGIVLVGVRADDSGAELRSRSASMARRLRALADPTRLAIVASLRTGPATVTELAARFGLAQPTVSNHVKLLRDSGVVADRRDGARRNLVVRHDVVDTLMSELARMLEPPQPRPKTSGPQGVGLGPS